MFDQMQIPTTLDTPSYAIGPMDSTHLTTLQAYLSNGLEVSLPVPAHLLPVLLSDAEFKDGYEYGYFGGTIEEEWTIAQVVNYVHATLHAQLLDVQNPNVYTWAVGFVLGSLTDLAETRRTLGLVGISHLCFLLSCVPLDTQLGNSSFHLIQHLDSLHKTALRAYRARVRLFREQGMSFSEAQIIALAGGTPSC